MTTQDKTYNGWTNYETWLVNLWIQNDEDLYSQLHDMVVTVDTLFAAKEILMAWMDNEYDTYVEHAPHGLFQDLLRGALAEVDWYEIAKDWRDEE
jgi:hypothetical protein